MMLDMPSLRPVDCLSVPTPRVFIVAKAVISSPFWPLELWAKQKSREWGDATPSFNPCVWGAVWKTGPIIDP